MPGEGTPQTAPLSDPLDFETERDKRTESWERADPASALMERLNRYGWTVTLPGGNAHTVALARHNGAWVGWCDCKGYEYRNREESPCAHLCTLRQAHVVADADAHGNPIEIPDAGNDASTTEARADGGRQRIEREPAGDDEREFGRPENRL